MKSHVLKLLLVITVSFLMFSCGKEDDGIYFNETSEVTIAAKVSYSVIESDILTLVNNHRTSLNLSELSTLNIISDIADDHTNYMIDAGHISHDNFAQRAQNLMDKANAKSVAENVAYGYGTAQGVVDGWLNSEGHKEIIETPDLTHFGISTKSNSEGRNYFTQIFIKK